MGKLFEIWQQWCDLTTFHGFNELGYLRKLSFKSLIWSVLIIVATFAAIIEISRVFQDWQHNPTAVQVEEIPMKTLRLPDLILCSGSRLDTKRLRQAGASESLINGLIFSTENPMVFMTKYRELKGRNRKRRIIKPSHFRNYSKNIN